MNYVILNGRKSTEITGLLIQSLPPITKPSIRTQVDVINGRDGEIVTNLGYSAYDKTMRIGLFGCYDIDEVISYFNGSGEVVFSNEPDKVYQFRIVKQIDFKRLIRFRQADVVFHVQPFKHSLIETPKELIDTLNFIEFSDMTMTQSGLTLTAYGSGNTIEISGTQTARCEFYIPITPVTLPVGDYCLTFDTSGTPDKAFARLIADSPVRSFGGTYTELAENRGIDLYETIDPTEVDTFNYIYLDINGDGTQTFDFMPYLNYLNTMPIRNDGNIESKPTLKVIGNGETVISLNGMEMFRIDLDGEIVIDTEKMEAYKGDQLRNRSVSGDYEKFSLKIGLNEITFTGNVSQIVVSNYSRWI